jgi:hypothetical protein
VFSEQIVRPGDAVASDHLRSSSYGASANLARSRHSGATAERLPYLRRSTGTQRSPDGTLRPGKGAD